MNQVRLTMSNDNQPPLSPPSSSASEANRASSSTFGSRIKDRLASLTLCNDAQSNLVSLFKSIIDEDLTGEHLRREIAETFRIEDIVDRQVQSNSEIYRPIRYELHDGGLDTTAHATQKTEHLCKRIIRTIWTQEDAIAGIEAFETQRKAIRIANQQNYIPEIHNGNPSNVQTFVMPVSQTPVSTPTTNATSHQHPYSATPVQSIPVPHLYAPGGDAALLHAQAQAALAEQALKQQQIILQQQHLQLQQQVLQQRTPISDTPSADVCNMPTSHTPDPNNPPTISDTNNPRRPDDRNVQNTARSHQRHAAQAHSCADERRKALKAIQIQYAKTKFKGFFEDNWRLHFTKFEDICRDFWIFEMEYTPPLCS